MLKLIIQSLIELFYKLFSFLENRRTQKVAEKHSSYALDEAHNSITDAHILKQLKDHSDESAFNLLENNLQAFISRCKLIKNAQKTLDLQYYYFHGDTSGRLIAQLLIEAANRGVRVRLLLDDIDTIGADEPIRILNAHPDIEIRIFNPFYFRGLLRYAEFITDLSRVGRRMHNKTMIADNFQAVIGGRNIGDIYFAVDPELLFLDIDLLSIGPIVKKISISFDEYWNSRWAIPVDHLYTRPDKLYAQSRIKLFLKRRIQDVALADYEGALHASCFSENINQDDFPLVWSDAQLFYDEPAKIAEREFDVVRQLKNDLHEIVNSATQEITIISPYFVPGAQGLAWFKNVVAKGIKINVFTNSLAATDVVAVHAGYTVYRHELLQAGVNLYELKPSAYARERKKFKLLRAGSRASLHAKTMIVDQAKVFIGSPNLDPRSIELNTEIGMLVNDRTLAMQVMKMFEGIAEPRNSYKLEISQDDNSNQNKNIIWKSQENGVAKVYRSDPQASLWRKLSVLVFRLLPMEEFL